MKWGWDMKQLVVALLMVAGLSWSGLTGAQAPAALDSTAVADSSAVPVPDTSKIGAIAVPDSAVRAPVRDSVVALPVIRADDPDLTVKTDLPTIVKRTYPAPETIMVLVQVAVGTDGFVQDVRVIKSVPLLDVRAVEAAWQWEFVPRVADAGPLRLLIPFKFAVTSAARP